MSQKWHKTVINSSLFVLPLKTKILTQRPSWNDPEPCLPLPCLAPSNKHCTFFHYRPVSVDQLCCCWASQPKFSSVTVYSHSELPSSARSQSSNRPLCCLFFDTVILWFIVRNIYLVLVPISGTELLKLLEFPKWWEQQRCPLLG